MDIHYRSGRPNYGCTSPRAIKEGHERDSTGVCALCGDAPTAASSMSVEKCADCQGDGFHAAEVLTSSGVQEIGGSCATCNGTGRATPIAAQLDADNLPPLRTALAEVTEKLEREAAENLSLRMENRQYAERIRLLERELKATRTVSDHHFDTILELRANIDGLTAGTASDAAREGFALVPLVATKEMLQAGMRFFHDKREPASKAWEVYKAMIAAAPSTQENANADQA